MRAEAENLIYLTACAIHQSRPLAERVLGINHSELWRLASAHNMASIVAAALESSAPFREKAVDAEIIKLWSKAYFSVLTKEINFDSERAEIIEFMENNGIWYTPLKGILIKELYPMRGMRDMSDNDILFDENYSEKMRGYMVSRGYEVESIGVFAHDTYLKEPLYNFELHRMLFEDKDEDSFFEYYQDIKSKLIKDEDNNYGYHFSDDDFYVYITAHTYGHFISEGTGFKSFADNFLYLQKKKDTLNREYIEAELEKLGILEFEKTLRSISYRMFSAPDSIFTAEFGKSEMDLLSDVEIAGTYGSMQSSIKRKLYKLSDGKDNVGAFTKLKYLLGRLFPSAAYIRSYSRAADKFPVLIPFIYPYRVIKSLVVKRKAIKAELDSANAAIKDINDT